MSAIQIIGALICASPFVALFVWVVREGSWREAFVIFGGTAALVAVLAAGSYLMTGGK